MNKYLTGSDNMKNPQKGNLTQKKNISSVPFVESLGFGSKLVMINNRELSVEGCKGILEYETDSIRLNLGNQQLKITGRNLSVRALERNRAEINGYITGMEFDI
jgi:sporulation protein YqfC